MKFEFQGGALFFVYSALVAIAVMSIFHGYPMENKIMIQNRLKDSPQFGANSQQVCHMSDTQVSCDRCCSCKKYRLVLQTIASNCSYSMCVNGKPLQHYVQLY